MQKKTKIIIIVASASALVLVAVGAFLFYLRENERATSIDSSNYTRLADGVTDQGVTDANLGSFADRYSGDFVTARDDVSMTAETSGGTAMKQTGCSDTSMNSSRARKNHSVSSYLRICLITEVGFPAER